MKLSFRTGSYRQVLRCVILLLAAGAAAVPATAMRIVLTNDDGFESRGTQALFTALKAAGHEVIMSAPYRDQSGTSAVFGSLSGIPPTTARSPGGTIAAGTPGIGPTTLGADQYYIDSTPVAAAIYGIEVLARAKWGVAPDLVIAGPNIGNNLGAVTPHSGTVGAVITVLNRGIPAIAVSGANADPTTTLMLADLTLLVVAAVQDRGRVALPSGTGLNVNMPALDTRRTVESYRFAFTQVSTAGNPADNNPFSEGNAIADGSTVTVSPIQGTYQAPPDKAAQVLSKMRGLFATTLPIENPKLTNLSVRGYVGTGSGVQIAGFFVFGSSTKTVLIRASGPALRAFGVSDALADPIVELFDRDSRLVGTNDNWSDDVANATAIAAAAARVGAFVWTRGSTDAALLIALAPGPYTVVVKGAGETTGIALIEAYDINID